VADAPLVDPAAIEQVAERVHVIPDARVEFVPNVGIVVGDRAVLVVETAMGRSNGERILEAARALADDRPLLLTTTHFHPEHAFGAEPIAAEATYVTNAAQAAELADKGAEYVEMFSGFGPELAELLDGVQLVQPHVVYEGERARIDLGGIQAELLYHGPAHTRGDQLVLLPDEGILFAGDLVENRFLPIFPDDDANGDLWLAMLDRLDALEPAVVVPGHGALGDRALIDELREYLVAVRERVGELEGEGRPLEEIEGTLDAEMRSRYAGWDNEMWITSAARSFHSGRATK
jgi:glyoxylase-like metal-dependent hydrolase (beta-lactamase superfamily II)